MVKQKITSSLKPADKKILNDVLKKMKAGNEKAVILLLKKNPHVLKHFTHEYTNRLSKRDSANFHASALMIALENNLSMLAKELLNAGAPVNFKDGAHRTALMVAAQKANNPLIKLLLKKGAKVNAKDIDGLSALIYAVGSEPDRKGVLAVVKTLLAAGANPNLKDANAIDYAEFEWAGIPLIDKDKIIKVLKKHGAVQVEPHIYNLDEFLIEFEEEN